MATFEGYERRIGKIEGVLKQYGFTDLDSMAQFVKDKGVDVVYEFWPTSVSFGELLFFQCER